MESLFNLILPVIAVIILSSIIDQITIVLEAIINKIPSLPDEFEWYIGYIIVLSLSFFVTSNGNFDLFKYFGFEFNNPSVGFFITALVISGGSTFISEQITLIGRIPELVRAMSSKSTTFKEERRDKIKN